MTEKNAKPQLRFAGFDDTWEQRKAVDIADYSKGNGYSKSDLTENGTPIILYGRLYTKYQFAIDEVDTFATPSSFSSVASAATLRSFSFVSGSTLSDFNAFLISAFTNPSSLA